MMQTGNPERTSDEVTHLVGRFFVERGNLRFVHSFNDYFIFSGDISVEFCGSLRSVFVFSHRDSLRTTRCLG